MNKNSHKSFVVVAAIALMLIFFESTGASLALAEYTNPAVVTSNNPVRLPANSPNPNKVFFADFGQFVANPLLRYWRLNGRLATFGGPMSRTFVDNEGHTVQFFQKFALAYYPELANTAWEVRPYHIGRLWLDTQPAETKAAFPFGRVNPVPNTKTQKYFPETGHTVAAGFYELYNRNGALFNWGFPLSGEYQLTMSDGVTYVTQLFERGRMVWTPSGGAAVDDNFGSQMATLLKAPVAVEINPEPAPGQSKIPDYSSWVWEHWADVNLSTQSITHYEGDIAVRNNLVTTGKPGYATPTGNFYISRRVYNERMRGGTIGSEEYYDLSNVLHTQYFTVEGHALHYAWWRSTFGYTGSHGCVNMNLADSLFSWNWMTIGSRVSIHY